MLCRFFLTLPLYQAGTMKVRSVKDGEREHSFAAIWFGAWNRCVNSEKEKELAARLWAKPTLSHFSCDGHTRSSLFHEFLTFRSLLDSVHNSITPAAVTFVNRWAAKGNLRNGVHTPQRAGHKKNKKNASTSKLGEHKQSRSTRAGG